MKTIPLTKGMVAVVDDDDWEWLSLFKWISWKNQSGNWYAVRDRAHRKPKRIYMHRFILGSPMDGVDHWDRDGLNNQRQNLRLANKSQNASNSKCRSPYGFKGVKFDQRRGTWHAQIRRNGVNRYLGKFDSPVGAAMAYDRAALEVSGMYARTNEMLGVLPHAL